MSHSSYKPSPLSYGSPRGSPFKRAQSPLAQSPATVRGGQPTTPTHSPEKNRGSSNSPASIVFSPRTPPQPVFTTTTTSRARTQLNNSERTNLSKDPLSHIAPNQLHAMRESFHLLSSNNSNVVTRSDVAQMLAQLGQDDSTSSVAAFFPPGGPESLNLAAYLQMLSSLVGALSPEEELGAAFAAFDADDSGQVDVQELREALLSLPAGPEIGGAKLTDSELRGILDEHSARRALARGMGADAGRRGEAFKYQKFMNAIYGGEKPGQAGAERVAAA